MSPVSSTADKSTHMPDHHYHAGDNHDDHAGDNQDDYAGDNHADYAAALVIIMMMALIVASFLRPAKHSRTFFRPKIEFTDDSVIKDRQCDIFLGRGQ